MKTWKVPFMALINPLNSRVIDRWCKILLLLIIFSSDSNVMYVCHQFLILNISCSNTNHRYSLLASSAVWLVHLGGVMCKFVDFLIMYNWKFLAGLCLVVKDENCEKVIIRVLDVDFGFVVWRRCIFHNTSSITFVTPTASTSRYINNHLACSFASRSDV